MNGKSYSTASSAKRAVNKILAMHEAAAEITIQELEDGRFTAHLEFAPGFDTSYLEADLEGFSWSRPAIVEPEKAPEVQPETPDAQPEADHAAAFRKAYVDNGGLAPGGHCKALLATAKGWKWRRKEYLAGAVAMGLKVNTAAAWWQVAQHKEG